MKTWIRTATLVTITIIGTTTPSGAASVPAPNRSQATAAKPADDNMTPYRTLATDSLNALKAHDTATAKAKAKQLEKAWDNDQKALQKQSPDVWKQIDDAMDGLIKPMQGKSPDVAKMQAAYDTFIAKLQLAVKR